jgi:hypothetical protein
MVRQCQLSTFLLDFQLRSVQSTINSSTQKDVSVNKVIEYKPAFFGAENWDHVRSPDHILQHNKLRLLDFFKHIAAINWCARLPLGVLECMDNCDIVLITRWQSAVEEDLESGTGELSTRDPMLINTQS